MALETTGLAPKVEQDLLDQFQQGVLDQLSDQGLPTSIIDFDDTGDPAVLLIRAMVANAGLLLPGIQATYNVWDLRNATGDQLDALLKFLGVPIRDRGSFSTAEVTFSGPVGLVRIAGELLQYDNGVRWQLLANVTIDVGGTGTGQVQAQMIGDVEAGPNTITILASTPTSGVSVTNEEAATPGRPTETHEQARRRAIDIRKSVPRTAIQLQDLLRRVEGVSDAVVTENPSDTPLAVDAEVLAPFGIIAAVRPTADAPVDLLTTLETGAKLFLAAGGPTLVVIPAVAIPTNGTITAFGNTTTAELEEATEAFFVGRDINGIYNTQLLAVFIRERIPTIRLVSVSLSPAILGPTRYIETGAITYTVLP